MCKEENKFDLKKFVNGHNIIRKDTGWEYRSIGEIDADGRLLVQEVETQIQITFPLSWLVNETVMKPKTKWVNFYKDATVQYCIQWYSKSTKEEALSNIDSCGYYIGTFEVEVDE